MRDADLFRPLAASESKHQVKAPASCWSHCEMFQLQSFSENSCGHWTFATLDETLNLSQDCSGQLFGACAKQNAMVQEDQVKERYEDAAYSDVFSTQDGVWAWSAIMGALAQVDKSRLLYEGPEGLPFAPQFTNAGEREVLLQPAALRHRDIAWTPLEGPLCLGSCCQDVCNSWSTLAKHWGQWSGNGGAMEWQWSGNGVAMGAAAQAEQAEQELWRRAYQAERERAEPGSSVCCQAVGGHTVLCQGSWVYLWRRPPAVELNSGHPLESICLTTVCLQWASFEELREKNTQAERQRREELAKKELEAAHATEATLPQSRLNSHNASQDDAESPGEIPGGKVLKATKLGPHLNQECPQAQLMSCHRLGSGVEVMDAVSCRLVYIFRAPCRRQKVRSLCPVNACRCSHALTGEADISEKDDKANGKAVQTLF
eukprot:Skav202549  [mRNA]  locus=scaffold2011:379356:386632:- [translate_table: standard]